MPCCAVYSSVWKYFLYNNVSPQRDVAVLARDCTGSPYSVIHPIPMCPGRQHADCLCGWQRSDALFPRTRRPAGRAARRQRYRRRQMPASKTILANWAASNNLVYLVECCLCWNYTWGIGWYCDTRTSLFRWYWPIDRRFFIRYFMKQKYALRYFMLIIVRAMSKDE